MGKTKNDWQNAPELVLQNTLKSRAVASYADTANDEIVNALVVADQVVAIFEMRKTYHGEAIPVDVQRLSKALKKLEKRIVG